MLHPITVQWQWEHQNNPFQSSLVCRQLNTNWASRVGPFPPTAKHPPESSWWFQRSSSVTVNTCGQWTCGWTPCRPPGWLDNRTTVTSDGSRLWCHRRRTHFEFPGKGNSRGNGTMNKEMIEERKIGYRVSCPAVLSHKVAYRNFIFLPCDKIYLCGPAPIINVDIVVI